MTPETNRGQPNTCTECFHGDVDQFFTNHKVFIIPFVAFFLKNRGTKYEIVTEAQNMK